MFYKHWKKIALALTALFWAGCEDSASSAVCLYGPDPNYSSPAEDVGGSEGGAKDSVSTDSSATSSAQTAAASSSSDADIRDIVARDSLIIKNPEDFFVDTVGMEVVCLYGVPDFKIVKVDSVLTLDLASTLCYNDIAKNEDEKEFNIIDCTDGNKYLRNPADAGIEGVVLPEGVQVFAPKAGSEKAPNCISRQDICIERDPSKPIEQDSLAGCHPIIDCPEKPDTTTN